MIEHQKNVRFARRALSLGVSLALAALSHSAYASCSYEVQSSWNDGFVASITVTNDTSSAVSAWDVTWGYSGDVSISNSWSAEVSGSNPYTATNTSDNGTLAAGSSVSFGFQATGTSEEPTLTGSLCEEGSGGTTEPGNQTVFRVNDEGKITKDGTVKPIKCGAWFGLEGRYESPDDSSNPSGAPMELYVGNTFWANNSQGTGRTIQQTMTEIKAQGINTIRLPIAPQTLETDNPQGVAAVFKNHASVRATNSRQALEDFIKLADENDLDIILDIHSCSNYVGWRAGRLDATPPWTDKDRDNYIYTREDYSCASAGDGVTVQEYNEELWLEDLKEIAEFADSLGVNNILGIDIFNEPWDYTWAEWKALAEDAYEAINSVNENVLIFVEGIGSEKSDDTTVPYGEYNPSWGENFYSFKDDPLDIPKNRLVLSPHTYGPSVHVQPQFLDPSQSKCEGLEGDEAGDAECNIVIDSTVLKAGWEEHFGYLKDEGYAIVIGEFGGLFDWPTSGPIRDQDRWSYLPNDNYDETWQNTLVEYLNTKDIEACYWAINPESDDTGGLYQHAYDPRTNTAGWGEWLEFDTEKWDLLKTLWNE
jgi:aryl-phospho-beta-D-glucosidase BglC (GH1 family)